ncbi:MAG: phosphoribosylamine--glycine ligase [Gammaproteobacteria bacterium]|nr:phosphoribosylamine--glycine ligase [Gammaproteobacteria bacterium]
MDILVVGGGGREHALAWKAAQSKRAGRVYVAPGNAGTAREHGVENVAISAEDIAGLRDFALARAIGLTIIGPEAPLVAGIVDDFNSAGLRCFGPSRGAATLEGSKSFTKAFLSRHGIPTADFASFTDAESAKRYILEQGAPIVVKADGLAAGKGVVVASNVDEAQQAADAMLIGNRFGNAGKRVVIEKFLEGEEASFIVMCDGGAVLPLASSQDHKRRDDGDRGPNTGGMGAYSPAPVVTPRVHQRILSEIIQRTVDGMRAEGLPYTGFLYAGLMIAPDGAPRVIEYNCRLGDPEAQPILMRIKSDLVELCLHALEGSLADCAAIWDERAALTVVLSAAGYPDGVRKGDAISGLDVPLDDDVKIFHSGTQGRDGAVVTAGGRVLSITALGVSVAAAQKRAYAVAGGISWPGMFYRRDIGFRAVARRF